MIAGTAILTIALAFGGFGCTSDIDDGKFPSKN